MKVTAIKPRKKALSAVYIDGEFVVDIDYEVLLFEKIKEGMEITETQVETLIYKSDFKRAKSKGIWLLNYRDYTKRELKNKLLKEYSEEPVLEALNKLEDLGLIDDARYAERYYKDLINLKHLSPFGAKQKLILKGIDKELCEEIAENFEVDEKEQIRYLIERKYKNSLFDEKGKQRAFSALRRKGYRWEDINLVISEYTEE